MRNILFTLAAFGCFFSMDLLAKEQCNCKKTATSPLTEITQKTCEQTKESPRCQELYAQIKADSGNLSDKQLRCELDSNLTSIEQLPVSYISCLKGGVVGGIVNPIKDLGKLIGESAAKFVIHLQENSRRLKYCEEHHEQKLKIYETYNSSAPKLLQVDIPENLQTKSCVQVETDLYQARRLKERVVSLRVDHKFYQKNPTLTPEEKEYLDWKFKKTEFANHSDESLTDMADQVLEQYGVRIDCYNLAARSALRCEALFHITTMGVGAGKLALSALSGLKAERFATSVRALAQEAGSLKNISETDKIKLLLRADKLSPDERIKATQSLLERTLTKEQETALLKAHAVGNNKGSRVYSSSELKQKAEILKNAGFTSSERETLMRSGLTGEFDDYIRVSAQAQRAEEQAHSALLGFERKRIDLNSKLKSTKLSAQEKQQLESELNDIDNAINKIREDSVFGNVIGPGAGPADLARLERRIGFTSREIEIAEVNGGKITPLLERRAKTLRESAEFNAMGKNYSVATREYDLAAQDVSKALAQGGLKSFEDKVAAMRILENAGAEKYSAAYQELAMQIARSPQIKNRVLDPSKMEFSAAVQNPVVARQQKDSIWELVRNYRDQSTRIEIQRARNEDVLGAAWEKSQRHSTQFEAMLERRDLFKTQIEARLKQELGASGAQQVQKIMKQLFP